MDCWLETGNKRRSTTLKSFHAKPPAAQQRRHLTSSFVPASRGFCPLNVDLKQQALGLKNKANAKESFQLTVSLLTKDENYEEEWKKNPKHGATKGTESCSWSDIFSPVASLTAPVLSQSVKTRLG